MTLLRHKGVQKLLTYNPRLNLHKRAARTY